MSRLNIHIYPSDMCFETRIVKIANSLAHKNRFDDIHLVGKHSYKLKKKEQISNRVCIIRVKTAFEDKVESKYIKFLWFFSWATKILFLYGNQKLACINSHSISVLPLCIFLKYLTGAKLVYDTHELETETISQKGIRKLVSQFLEKICIQNVDAVCVVSDEINHWYKQKYSLKRVWTVKNKSDLNYLTKKPKNWLKHELGLANEDTLYIYQGLLAKGRSIQFLLEVFQCLTKKYLLFLGHGELEQTVKNAAQSNKNIFFHQAVPMNELSNYTSAADIGLCLIEPICLSYKYSMPNKLFEYLLCGIPVITNRFPQYQNLVGEKYGWTVNLEANDFKHCVNDISYGQVVDMKKEIMNNKEKFHWESEEIVLNKMYDNLQLV